LAAVVHRLSERAHHRTGRAPDRQRSGANLAAEAAKAPPASDSAGAAPPASRPGALAALALAMLLTSLGTSIANVALPTLAQAFGASFQGVQWVVLAYLLAITSLIVGVGRLGDMIGRRRLLLAGIGLFTAASVLCSVAPALWLMIAARAAQGLGAAVLMALAMALVSDSVPKGKTGSAMGLLGTMSAVGTALGPSLGGMLIAAFGWPAIFLINLPFGALTLLLASRFLPRDYPASSNESARFDTLGMLLLAATLAAYALAMTAGLGHFGTSNGILLAAATVGAVLFVRTEIKSPSPLVRLRLVREARLGDGLAMSALVSTVVMATLVVGPFYLSQALNLESMLVGIVMSVGPAVAALTGIPAGRIVDRFGTGRVTIAGLVAMSTGCFVLAALPATLGIPGYVAPLAVVASGYALFQTANNTSVMADVPKDLRGVVSGMLNLSRSLGLITGASVMGAVFAAAAHITAAQPAAVAAGMRTTYAVAAMLIVAALTVAAAGRLLRRRSRSGIAPSTK
jgi:EmrB/QacA subfamily drug resistance transporter